MKKCSLYISELYNNIYNCYLIDKASSIIKICLGRGQAELSFLKKLDVFSAQLCDKYSTDLANLCRRKCREYPCFHVINVKFENFHRFEAYGDIILSACVFYWVPDESVYSKGFQLALEQWCVFFVL